MKRQIIGRSIASLLLLATGLSLWAAPFEISRSTIDGGGIMQSVGGEFELSGTIGQPDAGRMTGGSFELTGGFWFEIEPGDCNEDGGISLADQAAHAACMDGPGVTAPEGCECHDLDASSTIDLADFAILQTNYARD